MSKKADLFATIGTGFPPISTFTFTNPNTSQSKGTFTTSQFSENDQPKHSKYAHPPDIVNEDLPNASTSYKTTPSKRPKPGPISMSELSSGTNAFKLRSSNSIKAHSTTSKAILRQEVFKKPHTLAFPPENLDTVITEQPATVRPLSTSANAVLKVTHNQRIDLDNIASKTPSSPIPFGKMEASSYPKGARTPRVTSIEKRRNSSTRNKSEIASRSTSLDHTVQCVPHRFNSEDSLPQGAIFSPILEVPQGESRYQTPIRGGGDLSTPSSERFNRESTSSIRDLRRKCEVYEATQRFDRELIASQNQEIEELSSKSSQAEEKIRALESKHIAEVKEVTRRANDSLAKLTNLHEKSSKANVNQIRELKQDLQNVRQEIQGSMSAVEPLLEGYTKMKNALREIAEEHEQQVLVHSDEKTRLQQTTDLLRDQLSDRTGNYTESLEREKELQASLVTLGDSHANVAKALYALHEQHDQIYVKYSDSRLAESTATKRNEELEVIINSLKTDNVRMKSLLVENEETFSCKLGSLGEERDGIRTSLEKAHRELGILKSEEQAARSQLHTLLQEKELISQRNKSLQRDLDLKIQSLDDQRVKNQALEQQLKEERHKVEEARTETGQVMGQLTEKERLTSAHIREWNMTLESHREREISLKSKIAELSALVSNLQEKVKEADTMNAEYHTLERILLEKRAEVERTEIDNGQLQSQVVQLELARNAFNEEVKQLRETSSVSREREAVAQTEVRELRRNIEEYRNANEKLRISYARMEEAMMQAKVDLEEAKEAHKLSEKQREASLLDLSKLQAEQKSVVDKASIAENRLRLAAGESQEHIKKLEINCLERETESKQLRHELNASKSAKDILESLASEFRNSIQQARSQREKIEVQEGKLKALSDQVSGQETELRLLEQRLASADARLAQSKAEADTHRAAAESARTFATSIETKLKQKEQDLEAIRIEELQSRRTDATAYETTTVLQNNILEQQNFIESLKSKVLELEKSSQTIVERYKVGKLTSPEKDLIGVITAGIVQEKNRTINNLKGELKRKENELEMNKAATASLKDSLAKQIKQTGELKIQLESNLIKDPAGWNSFNHKQMAVSSSPLSDTMWHAPDHDPPAPDSPAVQLTEQNARNRQNENERQHDYAQPTNSKSQQYRAPATTRLESGNTVDEIQEFEESTNRYDVSPTNRKRVMFNTEPTDDEEQDYERGTKRKTRTRKDNRVSGESSGPKQPSNRTEGTSAGTKGKATKRRKV
ncbi:hypothetical protein RHS03_02922, partial [Rhizoctonia solani]